jgi:hypothetical protein
MRRSALWLTAAVFCGAVACDEEENANHGWVGTGATVAMVCVESGPECSPPETTQSTVAATELYLCNYWDTSGNFQVEFQERGSGKGILVQIAGFTGAGSYVTSADGLTNVTVTYDDGQADAAGVEQSIPEHPCTITVQSNLAAITIPKSGDDYLLDVDLDVSCPSLGTGAVCPIDCGLTPSTFRLSVSGCLVSQ